MGECFLRSGPRACGRSHSESPPVAEVLHQSRGGAFQTAPDRGSIPACISRSANGPTWSPAAAAVSVESTGLAQAGANVVIVGRNADRLSAAADIGGGATGRVLARPADVTD